MGPLGQAADCCTPSCDEPVQVAVPGPAGATGATGAAGSTGVNAYTQTTAQFLMPAEGATVSVLVAATAWMVVGQILYAQTAGYLQVSSITNSLTVVLLNPENTAGGLYSVNAAPGTAIPPASKVSPGGVQGPAGALTGAAGGSLEGTYPNPTLAVTTTKGDIVVNNNGSVAPRNTRLAVGTNGNVVRANSATGTGLEYGAVNLAGGVNHVTGDLPIANGGTSGATKAAAFDALSPMTTNGDIITRSAGTNARVPSATLAGEVLMCLTAGGIPEWSQVQAASIGNNLGSVARDYLLYKEHRAPGTNAGGFTSGAWTLRNLTTEIADTGGHGVLALSQITLQTGTYYVKAKACAYKVDNHKVRFRNVSDGTTVAVGTNARASASGEEQTWSECEGLFTIASAKVFQLEHICQTTRATEGMGLAASFSEDECYVVVQLWRAMLPA